MSTIILNACGYILGGIIVGTIQAILTPGKTASKPARKMGYEERQAIIARICRR